MPRPARARVRALSGNSDVARAGVHEIASAVPISASATISATEYSSVKASDMFVV